MEQSSKKLTTFRIRGVPLDWSWKRLRGHLEQHDPSSNPVIKSFALETDLLSYTATVVFTNPPPLTQKKKPWKISLDVSCETQSSEDGHLLIDNDFLGITSLFSPKPSDHKLDIIAIGDINGNPLQSYEEVAGNHVWLRDILPSQLHDRESRQPMVRVMIYGYQSILEKDNSLATFDDLGDAILRTLAPLSSSSSTRPIILMGHGIGGLAIKEALVSLSKLHREAEERLFSAIRGVVFINVPHDGMNISLVTDASNQPLIESLRQANSELLSQMHNEYLEVLANRMDIEIFSFYGTLQSSITRDGETRRGVVVTRASATHCRRSEEENDGQYTCAIPRTHADIVKFEPHDPEYDNVRNRLLGMSQRVASSGVSAESDGLLV